MHFFPKWSSEHFFVTEAPSAGSGAPGLLGSRLALHSFRLALHVTVLMTQYSRIK